VQQRQVRVCGRRRAQGFEHEQLLGGVGEVVLPAHDLRDPRVEIVDRDREVVEHRAVGARDHGIVEMDVLERRVAPDQVVHHRRAFVGHVQPHRALGLRLAAEAPLGAVSLLEGADGVGVRG